MQHITININTVQDLNVFNLLGEDKDSSITLDKMDLGNVITENKGDESIREGGEDMAQQHSEPIQVYRGEIWLAELTETKYMKHGEQGGYRPVLVIQNNVGNRYSPTVIVACITSKSKRDLPTHVHIPPKYAGDKDSLILCEQIKTISKERLNRRIGSISMEDVDKTLLFSLGLDGKTN